MAKKTNVATYADGVGADRCTHCGAVLRHGGEPMVAIRRSDAEAMALIMSGSLTVCRCNSCETVRRELLQRLEQAVGRTVRQMKADQ